MSGRQQPSERQKQVLDLIVEKRSHGEDTPTFREIMEVFGYKSSNSVYQIMDSLVRKGYLIRRGGFYDVAPEEFIITHAQRDRLYALWSEVIGQLRSLLLLQGNPEHAVDEYVEGIRSRLYEIL